MVYITALSQLRFWLLVSGDVDGDDSELVDDADRGVSRSTCHRLSQGQGRELLCFQNGVITTAVSSLVWHCL